VTAHTVVGEHQAIVPEIEGSAWITGEHTFIVDDDDPLKNGFRLCDRPLALCADCLRDERPANPGEIVEA
jgi:hypothetical protein